MFKSAGRAPVYVPRCSYGSRISRFDWGELGLDGRFWRVCGTNGEPAVYGWPEANTVRRIFIRIGGAACPDIAGGRPGAAVSQGRPRPGRAEQPAARTRRPAFSSGMPGAGETATGPLGQPGVEPAHGHVGVAQQRPQEDPGPTWERRRCSRPCPRSGRRPRAYDRVGWRSAGTFPRPAGAAGRVLSVGTGPDGMTGQALLVLAGG